jgi:uncharacterized protein YbjT (DUF2867 family)
MKVIVFGATGMVGQGVLRECLRDPDVELVLVVGRSPTGQSNPKLREILHADLTDPAPIDGDLGGYDACFFCLGISSAGMKEAEYRAVTFDITLAVARALVARNPGMTFVYVSGAGTDSTERGRSMWARVKGQTENALLKLPFKATYMFRPGFIQAGEGIVSKTPMYRLLYAVVGPLYPLWKVLFPRFVTTTEAVGRAMLVVVKRGAPKALIENDDINAIARQGLPPGGG